MRRSTILASCCSLLLAVTTSVPAAQPAPDRVLDPTTVVIAVTDGELQRPAVEFDHRVHAEAFAAEGCATCHDTGEGGFDPGLAAVAGVEGLNARIDAYHDACTGCHRQRSRERLSTGPVTCGECHVRRGAAAPVGFAVVLDRSLHARHAMAYPEDCAACHHVWDETAGKLIHREKTEEACRGCHGDTAVENTPSLRSAVHRDCVGCHLDRSGRGEATGPTACDGCHDREIVAAVERLEAPPRLLRGQPDTVWVHDRDATSPAVGFDHLAHEEVTTSCSTCHHRTLKPCGDCHTLAGSADGGGVTAAEASHMASSEHSCVGCHAEETSEPSCAGCHSALYVVPATRSCVVCHHGPSGGDALDTAPVTTTVVLEPLPPVSDDFPETVVIDLLVDEYGESSLPHAKIVARLDDIARQSRLATRFHGGTEVLCNGCHHHTPAGERPPSCRSCHPAKPGPALDRPGLKVAYHQQCLGCHIAMELPQQGCTDCHAEVER